MFITSYRQRTRSTLRHAGPFLFFNCSIDICFYIPVLLQIKVALVQPFVQRNYNSTIICNYRDHYLFNRLSIYFIANTYVNTETNCSGVFPRFGDVFLWFLLFLSKDVRLYKKTSIGILLLWLIGVHENVGMVCNLVYCGNNKGQD